MNIYFNEQQGRVMTIKPVMNSKKQLKTPYFSFSVAHFIRNLTIVNKDNNMCAYIAGVTIAMH